MTHNQRDYYNNFIFSDVLTAGENMIYHTLRSSFFDRLDRMSTIVVLSAGATAFSKILDNQNIEIKILSALFFVISAVQLAFNFSKKTSIHETLKSKYADILGKLQLLPFETDEIYRNKMLVFFKNELSNFYKDEPKGMLALKIIARNQFINSCYEHEQRTGEMIELKWHHKWFAQIWSFDTLDLTMNKEKKQIIESKEKQ